MYTFPRRSVALVLLLGMSECIHADEAADRRAIEAAAQTWTTAFNARDVDAMLGLTTDDVVWMVPDAPPVGGRDPVRAFLRRELGGAKGQLENVTKEIVPAGDVAWRIAALAHRLPGGEVSSRGQSLEIWKRVGSRWKIHRRMSSGLLTRPRVTRPDPSQPVLDKPVD